MREPEEMHDHELSAALREAVPAPPVDAVDWSALHGRIVARAAPLLTGRATARPGVWQTLSGWATGAIPLTAAAAAVLLLVLGTGVYRSTNDDVDGSAFQTVEEALADDLFSGSAPLLIADATDDDVFDALLFYEEGER
jgi:negative regulator of sigma E activity